MPNQYSYFVRYRGASRFTEVHEGEWRAAKQLMERLAEATSPRVLSGIAKGFAVKRVELAPAPAPGGRGKA